MIDFGLEACPLCGGEAEIVALAQGPEHLDATIRCTDCGLTLVWKTEFSVSVSRSGKRVAEKIGPDPIEAWNRRVVPSCAACHANIFAADVLTLPECNGCGVSACEYKPQPGELTRINCPLWRAKEE